MNENTILVILGSFISLLLIVNAYFTRETLLRVVLLEVHLKENSTKQIYNERQLDDNTREIRKLRDRMHSVEGASENVLKFLESLEK